jgi:dihydrodiol dehydrogenase / D-xylose 1-dehydrogenase (NADP)
MLRWAIIGTSFISDTMARAISASPGSTATIVAGRDPHRLASFRARHDIPRAVTSLDEALRAVDVDVVYVGTPNHVHHEATIMAAHAGKAVLSEKSLTVSMEQAEALLSAVRERVFFVEGLMYLSHPVIARFVDVLRDGRLGSLRAIHASYAADIAHLVNPSGRGAIYNLGCYPASLVQLVIDSTNGTGSFAEHELTAFGSVSATDGNVCESAATVRFRNGSLATIHTAETYGSTSRFEVQGTNGTLSFTTNPWLPQRGDNSFVWQGYHGGEPEVVVVNDPLDAFDHQVRMVERNVAAGRTEAERPSPRLDDSLHLMRFLTEWERSSLDRPETGGRATGDVTYRSGS